MRHLLAPQSRHICLILRLRGIKVRLNKDEYKRKLKIFGLIFITLLLPFVISLANFTIIFLLQDTFGIANDSMSFIIHLIGLILQCVLLWIIFIKTKEKYLADAYIAGICFISIFIGMFFFAIWIEVYPHLSSYNYNKMINSPDCCP